MNILQIENVSKVYSGHTALDEVSFNVPAGGIYGLLGPNGAGKTTLIRIINRITAPDSGVVWFNGHRLCENDIYNIGYLPEERGLYKKMKVGEQAIFFARLKGLSKHDANIRLKFWFEKFGITDWWNKKVEELSKGMAQKIQFITTILHEPELLIFDEPFSGFDPINANLLKSEILELRDKGATIIFSTHNMGSVEEICDNITLINKSKNILSGKVDDIRRQFGADRYLIEFSGDVASVESQLIDKAEILRKEEAETSSLINIHINQGSSLKEIINIINNSVELKSVNEDVLSMNDIFIRAVNEANNSNR